MILPYLYHADWEEPPPAMDMQLPYGLLLQRAIETLAFLRQSKAQNHATQVSMDQIEAAIRLYCMAPGIVNVMLNYKICVEHDLPLHPTVYYELKEARKYRINHEIAEIEKANRLYRRSIHLARDAVMMTSGIEDTMEQFRQSIPRELLGFVYSGIRDKYTWRGSDPALLGKLAEMVRASYAPDILIAAAHGSIMPALLLAELLDIPLYFVRLSMFKRHDEEPIIAISDEAWLFSYRESRALLYDEDVAGGRTLSLFEERLKPLFAETRTACSIRHAGASIKPDFAARTWWD
ncbi:MAG: phosphoribosyltransferase domain-containing protein [Spirochaetia bacterium]|nr:phosphoribosyltransferase domain-containing protein [Spirochaetia bacterium]